MQFQKNEKKPSTAGFEPAQAKPNRFRVCLLNHSDISTIIDQIRSNKDKDVLRHGL